jgi:hypothetical protein
VPHDKAEDLYQKVIAEWKRIEDEEAAAAAQKTIQEGRRQLPDPWLELSGWLSHLKGRMRAELLSARLIPEDKGKPSREHGHEGDEAALGRACRAMRRLIQKAYQISQPEVVGRPALELIERREMGAEVQRKIVLLQPEGKHDP